MSVPPPSRDGVEWLVPEVHESLGSQEHDRFGGKRTLDYVVRLQRAGDVDLGELRLPFWDPDAKAYGIARASLGSVRVKASATPTGQEPPRELLPGLPPARMRLEGFRGARVHSDDSPLFWLLGVVGWPAAFGLAFGAKGLGERVSRIYRHRRTSPAAELRQRVAAAHAASRGKNPRDADAATVRALLAATVAHAGVNIRGAAGGDDVAARLSSAGVSKDAAANVAELLVECEAARFAPDASDVSQAGQRWARAQQVIAALGRQAR
jgi:hypothetical protein